MNEAAKGVFRDLMLMLGLDGPYEQSFYVEEMEGRFGKEGGHYLDVCDALINAGTLAAGSAPLYELMAANPDMARFIIAHSWSEIYRETGDALIDSGLLEGREVVDFGCGFGLLTVCLANATQSSRFCGLDVDAVIPAARRLVEGVDPGNVSLFESSRAAEVRVQDAVVMMNSVTHEIWDGELSGAPVRGKVAPGRTELELVRRWVGERGLLVTVNRLSNPKQQMPKLDTIFARAGLRPAQTALREHVRLEGYAGLRRETLLLRVYAGAK